MKQVLLLSMVFFAGFFANASEVFNAKQNSPSSYESLVESLTPGTVLVLGELHNHPGHHDSHKRILEELLAQGKSFHVGMEFFYWPDQPVVDQYLYDEISEDEFLKQITWGQPESFPWYRPKILLPLESGGKTFAINAPRALTGAVAKEGLENIDPELQELMPPNFEIGNDQYLARFSEAVGGDHFPEELLMNYFTAQSIWDDTMAWKSLTAIEENPSQDIFVIIVGDFHVSFGGGLPDRLLARGASNVVSVSHVDSTDLTETDKQEILAPHPEWGLRSEWIVFSER